MNQPRQFRSDMSDVLYRDGAIRQVASEPPPDGMFHRQERPPRGPWRRIAADGSSSRGQACDEMGVLGDHGSIGNAGADIFQSDVVPGQRPHRASECREHRAMSRRIRRPLDDRFRATER